MCIIGKVVEKKSKNALKYTKFIISIFQLCSNVVSLSHIEFASVIFPLQKL